MSKKCQLARTCCRRLMYFGLLVATVFRLIAPAHADVIVLANRALMQVPLRFVPLSGEAQQFTLAPDMTVPMFVDGRANVMFGSKGTPKQYRLRVSS